MKKGNVKNKIVPLICIISAALIAAVGYFGYGATLLDPDSDRSIIASVSKTRHGNRADLGDSAVEILAKKQYDDYFAVLYNVVPSGENEGTTFFSVYKKHKAYANRYAFDGGTAGASSGAWDMVYAYPMLDPDAPSSHIACFFACTASSEKVCSVFEYDLSNPLQPYVCKLEEYIPPQNEPYIVVREYDLTKAGNAVTCFDGLVELSDLQ